MSETATPPVTPATPRPAASRRPRPRSGGWGKWVFILMVIGGGIAGWWWYSQKPKEAAVEFRTTAVTRGDIVQEVTANGSLSPVKNVEVGSQVSGIIKAIKVDFNSHVKEGELLALIDASTYEQNLVRSTAELANSTASLELAQINYRRASELFKNKLISAAEHDTTLATLHQAEAAVKIREASVQSAKVDLSRTEITAPISGVVISRNVDEGQTVAASFNTPRLFVIANDLTKMQIEAAVSEADVGGVEVGQKVNFSVDAFPGRKFVGRIEQVRYAATTNQNVVTYTTVIDVSNPDLKLRPGMTAVARIVTAEKPGVLRVPNSALRFRPPPGTIKTPTNAPVAAASGTNKAAAKVEVATSPDGTPIPPWSAERRRPSQEEREKWEASLTPEQAEKYRQMREQMRQRMAEGGGGGRGGGGFGGGGGDTVRQTRADGPTTGTIYVMEKGSSPDGKESQTIKAVTVKVGITDGTNSEILEGLKEGDVVITGTISAATTAAGAPAPASNPFGPSMGGGFRPR